MEILLTSFTHSQVVSDMYEFLSLLNTREDQQLFVYQHKYQNKNIFLCVVQKIEMHTGFTQLEGEL